MSDIAAPSPHRLSSGASLAAGRSRLQALADGSNRTVRRLVLGPQRRTPFGSDVRNGLVYSIYDVAFFAIAAAMLAGAYVTGYALHLGFTDFHIGLLGAIPMLAGLTGLLGSWLAEATGKRRGVVLWLAGLGRLLWIPLVVLPFCGLEQRTLVWSVLLCYGGASLMQGVASAPWLAWMGDLVPEAIRGRYWGRRNEVVQLASAAGLVVGGWSLDQFIASGYELQGYVFLFSIGLVFAAVSMVCLVKQHHPPVLAAQRQASLFKGVRAALGARQFRGLLVAGAIFHVGVGLSGAFIAPYMLEDLGMSFSEISAWSVYSLLCGFVASRYFGKAMDKHGILPVMKFNLLLSSLIPLLWILCMDFGWWMMALNWTVAGAGWAGYGLAALNWAFALVPKEGRSYGLALPGIVGGLGFFAASTLAGVIATLLPEFRATVGPFTFVPIHVLLLLSLIGRFVGMHYYMKLRDADSPGLGPIFTMQINLNYVRWMNIARIGRGYKPSPEEQDGGGTA
jgi:MFS family permease